MSAQFFGLMLGILGVWRITHLLHAEKGPWNVFDNLRRRLAAGFSSSVMGCFYCVSVWVAVPFTLLLTEAWKDRLLFWPALSAGAILLERFTSRAAATAPALYFEEEDKHDVLLRKDDGEPAPREFNVTRNGWR